jgi:hypothetical protein
MRLHHSVRNCINWGQSPIVYQSHQPIIASEAWQSQQRVIASEAWQSHQCVIASEAWQSHKNRSS